jgi:hypothetical protein
MRRWLEAHGRSTLPALKPVNTNAWAKLHVQVELPQLLLLLTEVICSNVISTSRIMVVKQKCYM